MVRGKHSANGKGKSSFKRAVIDLETKMKIIRKYEGGRNLSSIAREFGYALSTVNSIVKNATRITEYAKGASTMKAKIITKKREGAINEMEKLLIIWIEDQIQKQIPLSLLSVQAKAKSIFENIKGNFPYSTQTFEASRGWFCRFKNRAGFHNFKISGDAASGNTGKVKEYSEWLKKLIDKGSYLPEQIFNVVETRLFYHKMPSRTYISREEETTPGYRASKKRVTLLLGGNASGTYKLKPLLLHTSADPRALKGICKATLPVYFRFNKKAWVTTLVFEDWFMNCFMPEIEKYCLESGIPFKILLILDSASAHPSYLDDISQNVNVVYLPPNITSLLQPMEQGVIAKFKTYYLRAIFAQAISVLDLNPEMTLRDFWNVYSIYDAIKNIDKAWAEVALTCMRGVWKQLTPQFVPDFAGFTNDNTFEEIAETIVELAQQLQIEVDEIDVKELIESHSEELINEETIESEAEKAADNKMFEVTDEPEEEPKRFTAKDMREAVHYLNGLFDSIEKQDPNVSRFLRFQRIVTDAFSFYKEIYEKKKKDTIQGDRSSTNYNTFFGEPSSAECTAPITSTTFPGCTSPHYSDTDIDDVKPFLSSFPSSFN